MEAPLRFKVLSHMFTNPSSERDVDVYATVNTAFASAADCGVKCSKSTVSRALNWAHNYAFIVERSSVFGHNYHPYPKAWHFDPELNDGISSKRFFDGAKDEQLLMYIQLAENIMLSCAQYDKPIKATTWSLRLKQAQYELGLRNAL